MRYILLLLLIAGCASNEQVLNPVADNTAPSNHEPTADVPITDDAGTAFSTASEYVSVPYDDMYNIKDELTITAWVKPASTDTAAFVARLNPDTKKRSYGLLMVNSQLWFWTVPEDGSYTYTTKSKGTLEPGIWQHVAMAYDSEGRADVYINGKKDNGEIVGEFPTSVPQTDVSLTFGREENGKHPYIGSIAEVRMYNRALADDEIYSIYLLGNTPEPELEEGMVGYWPLDTMEDVAGNNDAVRHSG